MLRHISKFSSVTSMLATLTSGGLGWKDAKTTVLGSELAMVGGVLATPFGFLFFDSGQSTLVVLANVGLVVTGILFIIGLILLRQGATPNASAGFAAFAITGASLTIASSAVDSVSTSGGAWAALDVLLIMVGSVAALVGGLYLATSLSSLTSRSGLGKAAGYAFLAGGILQMAAGVPDSAGIALNSVVLENIGNPFYGIAGLLFTVLAPILLYLAVRRLRRSPVGQT